MQLDESSHQPESDVLQITSYASTCYACCRCKDDMLKFKFPVGTLPLLTRVDCMLCNPHYVTIAFQLFLEYSDSYSSDTVM